VSDLGRCYQRNEAWYLDYRDHRGNRVRTVAQGVRNRRQAEKLLATREAQESWIENQIALGLYDGRHNHVEVEPLLEAYLMHTVATKRYATAFAWREALADTVGAFEREAKGRESRAWPPRQETALGDLKAIRKAFVRGPLDVGYVDEITPARIEAWIAARRGSYQGRTLILRVKVLKAFLNWAVREGRIRSNPIQAVQTGLRPAQGRWRALTPEEARALLDASPEPYRTMWLAFLTTGMRHGELVKLTWPDVSFPTNTIRVRQETCKTHRQRDIPMHHELRERLLALWREGKDPEGPVFPNANGKPWTENLDARFRACLRKAGIGPRVVKEGRAWWLLDVDRTGRPVREELPGAMTRSEAEAALRERLSRRPRPRVVVHSLRHTFATELIREGANPKVVSDLLGHSTVQMTLQTYAHVWPQDRETAIAKLSFGTKLAQGTRVESQVLGKTGTYEN
jgi:integrase